MSNGPPTRGSTNSANNANSEQLSQLGRAVSLFQMRYSQFKALSPREIPADMRREYDSIARKSLVIAATIDKVLGGVDRAKSWVGLGFAFPFIPVAIALSAAAGILGAYRLLDNFMIRVGARRAMDANPGMTYAEALVAAKLPDKPGFLAKIGNNLTLIAVAFGAIYLLSRR